MTRLRKMRAGRWAVIVAAYALLCNVILTTTLFASQSPQSFDPLHDLCLNTAVTADGAADQNAPHKHVISCPLCLSHNALSFIAPSAPVLWAPAPTVTIAELPVSETIRTVERPHDGWPRGPPSLV
ncbi:MAG TPA: hypothetical protein VGC26_08410 [Afipia sp.]